MDADTLVKKAQQSIKNRDYDTARDYLKEAAGLAPLRSDIREMLQFVIQRQGSLPPSGRAQRRSSEQPREQAADRERDQNHREPPRRDFAPREFAPDEQENPEEQHRPPEVPRRLTARVGEENRRNEDRPARRLFQSERDRVKSAGPGAERPSVFSSAQPPKRHSFLLMFVSFSLIALVLAGGVTAFILMRPDIIKNLPQLGGANGPSETEATTGTTSVTTALDQTDSLSTGDAKNPTDPSEALAAATSLANQEKYEEASQIIQKSIDANPAEKTGLSKHLSEIFFAWGKDLVLDSSNMNQAVEKLQMALQSDPENPQIHHWLGEAFLLKARASGGTLKSREGDFLKAEKALKEAIRLDANMVKSYYTLGRTYAAKAQPEKAAQSYSEVIRRAPDSREAERARSDLNMMDMRPQ